MTLAVSASRYIPS